MMPKRNILLYGALLLLIPVVAFFAAHQINTALSQQKLTPAERTKEAVQSALIRENEALPSDEQLQGLAVESIERKHSIWYITTVTYKTDDGIKSTATALVGDFRNSAEDLTVILRPGEPFPYGNISNGMGVPYDVIDQISGDENE